MAIEGDLVKDQSVVSALIGISAILDHRCSAISTIADVAAALCCEALKADVYSASSPFNLTDSGDGSTAKDDVAVAGDFKVFFTGSKMIGSNQGVVSAVSRIPKVHGSFREISRFLHARIRVELNSGFKVSDGYAEATSVALQSLALALCNVAEISSQRTRLLRDLIASNDALCGILQQIDSLDQGDSLKNHFMEAQEALIQQQDYVKFAHQINCLSGVVRKIIVLEGLLAFVLLEGGPSVQANEGKDKTDNKKPEKKKKMVMGKGTAALLQALKDRIAEDDWVQSFDTVFDPKNSGFESLINKVKDIVQSNESRRLPKIAKGTRDFAKEQMTIREKAFSIITGVFKRHGAMSLDTPVFELRETLMGKYGEDSKLIYDLADQGGELCSLRYDLTVPFARYVAMNGLTSFKRYQIAKVYRRDNPSKGRYREFYQCDFDIAGQFEKMGPDFEVIKILTELLDELDIGEYEVKLNHRKLLDGMLAICGVPQNKFRTICSSIDKLDKQSFEQIKKELVDEKGLTVETADQIGLLVKERGSPVELLSKLKQEGSKFLENDDSVSALNELEIMFKALEESKCINRVVFDLSLARGLDYYTGVIFEAVFKGATQVGSIAAGGRYDNLIGMFGTKQVPAVGISLGIERVFTIMELQKDKNQGIRATETQVLVSILGDDLSLGARFVNELWDAKIKAEYMVNKRVKKHLDRAIDSKIPWMIIVGERELNEGIVKLKDMGAAVEYEVPISSLVEELRKRLDG